MNPDLWQKVESILDGALDLPPDERDAFVEAACGGDAELCEKVRSMLDVGGDAAAFLDANAPGDLREMRKKVRSAVDKAPEDDTPATIGPYRIVRRIGHGGMGQVFLAVRDDESYTRYVALKVIRRGMDTEEILKRFRMERRILASLNHPNIARLLDGGATEDGLSYFVMEYIDGKPINTYCESNRVTLRKRLMMFQQVCSAVHYAHQNLVVHRDLKPSNILVTADGSPKLLDFGIAKFLNPNLAGYTVPMTRTEVRVMTPEYASPEQMRGDTVTTSSDVYQLGILLYELLTGLRPYETAGHTRAEIERLVLEIEPDRPSTAVSRPGVQATGISLADGEDQVGRTRRVERLKRMLSGDLDRIVLMALRKEPERRYQSADQLLEDIRRYLAGLPVTAQKDTWGYRASKFVRRHRIGVAATAILAVLLIAISVLAVRYAVVTSAQSERIALAAAKTEQVKQFLITLFQVADPEMARGRDVTVREMLDRGAEQVDRELSGQPEIQAEMLGVIGGVYRTTGQYDRAEPLLERSLAMRRSIHGTENAEVAQSLYALGQLRDEQGDYVDGEALHREALEMRIRVLGPNHPDVAASYNDVGVMQANQGDVDGAEESFRKALAIRTEVLGLAHRATTESMSNVAWAVHERGRFEEAEVLYRDVLSMQRQLLGSDHPFVPVTLTNLGALLYDRGMYAEAEPFLLEALQTRTKILGDDHPQVASSLSWLGRVAQAQGRYSEAEPLFRDVLQRHRIQLGERHPRVGRDAYVLGCLLRDEAKYEEAEQLLILSLAIFREALDAPDHRFILDSRAALSELYVRAGLPDRSAIY